MDLFYTSTRDRRVKATASEAILAGLAPQGALFVPEYIPKFEMEWTELSKLDYKQTARAILSLYLTDFTAQELENCINRAYDDKFDTPLIAPLHKAGDAWFLELYHGATIAFKDMALSILPHLLITSARKNQIDRDIVILTATSGDTGKAALAGFADVDGTRIVVFYPKDGVSAIQEKQMITQAGANTCVIGINGNFDDAQTGVKKLFTDAELADKLEKMGFRFSSANSINIGRLVPQIAYYFYAYGQLLKQGEIDPGEKINITVPTGNFGNILAAGYARSMGLPVKTLICASNKNKVLTDFFNSGEYDKNREFYLTSSPSMDILISSNLERLIWDICGHDDGKVRELMNRLSETGKYEITPEMREKLAGYHADYASPEETIAQIAKVFREDRYLIDPHTAVASSVYDRYRRQTGDRTKTVIASTASPYKFTASVAEALGIEGDDDFELAEKISLMTKTKVPEAVSSLRSAPVRHKLTVDISQMEDAVLDFLEK